MWAKAALCQQRSSRGSSTRLWSNQEWALDDLPGVGDIVEYESRFNYIWPKANDVFVCVYDTSGFGAGLIMQIFAHSSAVRRDRIPRSSGTPKARP